MASYAPLLRQGKYTDDEDEHEPRIGSVGVCDCDVRQGKRAESLWETRTLKYALFAAFASLLCTFLNISFLALQRNNSSNISNDIKYTHVFLQTPSSYTGLERADPHPNEPAPAPMSGWPDLTAQVSEREPSKVFYENNRRFTNFGMAYPTDRKFRVAPGVSTIVQFRVRDWGMEHCTLTFATGMTPPASEHGHSRDEMHSHGHPTATGHLDVWQLTQQHERVDPERISWGTRPPRNHLLGTWDLTRAEALRSEEFHCNSTSLLTLELSCHGSEGCHLEFVQPREQPESALLLIQRSSV
ncbi:hypothetical protein C8F01DRAFT_1366418 [Mycena amicta]|nr:hypothetical protein C8F01DRAFT_1366418 [Mycena amicta]